MFESARTYSNGGPGWLVGNPQTAQVLARNELSLSRFRAGAVANRAERLVQKTEIRRSKEGALTTSQLGER